MTKKEAIKEIARMSWDYISPEIGGPSLGIPRNEDEYESIIDSIEK